MCCVGFLGEWFLVKIHLKMKTMTSSKFLLLWNYVVGKGYAGKRYICGGRYIFFSLLIKVDSIEMPQWQVGLNTDV